MKSLSKKTKVLSCAFAAVLSVAAFCTWQNNDIVTTYIDHASPKIPKEFSGFKIAHVSDLHNKRFGKNQRDILDKIKSIAPDIIVITGDLVDRRRYNLPVSMEFIEGALAIAPIYYVAGNHEAWSEKYYEISDSLAKAGVNVMDNKELQIVKGGESISILGARDPGFLMTDHGGKTKTTEITQNLQRWSKGDEFKILLSHRPELFKLYCDNAMDLVFAGHAHGGQVRLPLIGGIVAPNQGLFPQYTIGSYTQKGCTMVVSRGLGNSLFPLRVFNRPELVAVTLRRLEE